MKILGVGLRGSLIGMVCLVVAAFGTAFAQEEDSPMVAGVLWGESSHPEKTAYLVGAGNLLTVEYIVQQKSDNQPSDEQSSIRQWWNGLEDVSLDDLINTVDTWYQENPEELQVPVLVVLWNSYIEAD